jgi:hypothetical protein
MTEQLAGALPGRAIHVVADSSYAGGELKGLPATATWTTRLRKDAALHRLPPQRTGRKGRPRMKGERLPSLDLSGADEAFRTFRAFAFATFRAELLSAHPDLVGPNVTWNTQQGLELTTADLSRATVLRAELADRITAFFADVDVLACPVSQVAPFDVTLDWVHEINGKPLPDLPGLDGVVLPDLRDRPPRYQRDSWAGPSTWRGPAWPIQSGSMRRNGPQLTSGPVSRPLWPSTD